MRITTRRLMIAVAVVAVALVGYQRAARYFESLGGPYEAERRTTQSWDLGPAPDITVDCSEGLIHVLPATDGRVTAWEMVASSGHDHRSEAEADVETVHFAIDHRGDTLRIAVRGPADSTDHAILRSAAVLLYVPSNVRLDLRTGDGNVVVGWLNQMRQPIEARSVRVRNDSPGRATGDGGGTIKVATLAPRGADGTPTPTRLQLDAPGRIEVDADLATVEAHAGHGGPLLGQAEAMYEAVDPIPWVGQGEGTLRCAGRLAGASALRAAHRIDLKLGPAPHAATRPGRPAASGPTRARASAMPSRDGAGRWPQCGEPSRRPGRDPATPLAWS